MPQNFPYAGGARTSSLSTAKAAVETVRSRVTTAGERTKKKRRPRAPLSKTGLTTKAPSGTYVQLPPLPVDPVVVEILELSRLQRRVSRAQLVRDILTGWVATVPDLRQALFTEVLGKVRLPALYEQWPGYLQSLGFGHLIVDEIPPDAVRRVVMPPAVDEEERQPAVSTAPAVNTMPPDEPIALPDPVRSPAFQGVPSSIEVVTRASELYRPPEREPIDKAERDVLAGYGGPGVGRFDDGRHAETAQRPGSGNAAQEKGWR